MRSLGPPGEWRHCCRAAFVDSSAACPSGNVDMSRHAAGLDDLFHSLRAARSPADRVVGHVPARACARQTPVMGGHGCPQIIATWRCCCSRTSQRNHSCARSCGHMTLIDDPLQSARVSALYDHLAYQQLFSSNLSSPSLPVLCSGQQDLDSALSSWAWPRRPLCSFAGPVLRGTVHLQQAAVEVQTVSSLSGELSRCLLFPDS